MVSKTEILLRTAQQLESHNNGEDMKDKLIKLESQIRARQTRTQIQQR